MITNYVGPKNLILRSSEKIEWKDDLLQQEDDHASRLLYDILLCLKGREQPSIKITTWAAPGMAAVARSR